MSIGHLRLQSAIAPSGQVKTFSTLSRFFSIVEASTGNLGTSVNDHDIIFKVTGTFSGISTFDKKKKKKKIMSAPEGHCLFLCR